MNSAERVGESPRDSTAPWWLWQRIARDDLLSIGALVLLVLLAWQWTLHLIGSMDAMTNMPDMQHMPDVSALHWDFARAASTFAMWVVMMTAMMLPSATPIVLLHRRMSAHYLAQNADHQLPSTGLLISGYLLVWIGFSFAATLAQIGLSIAEQITPMMTLVNHHLAAVILLMAGIYQFAPIKQHCLARCRSPLTFLTQHYRAGKFGAFSMGVTHGALCLGCCWAAMALLFVGGVMNPWWIAGLSIFVLVEKLFPFGNKLSALFGIGAMGGAIYLWL